MGDNSTTSSSSPVSASQRFDTYNAFMRPQYWSGFGRQEGLNMEGSLPTMADYKQLSDGDYNRLEQNLVTSNMAPVNAAFDRQSNDIAEQMNKRGIWSSGAPIQATNRLWTESVLPAAVQAGANAATQRYNLQQQGNENAWNAKWRTPEYQQGIWNGTGGVISSSTGGGWSI